MKLQKLKWNLKWFARKIFILFLFLQFSTIENNIGNRRFYSSKACIYVLWCSLLYDKYWLYLGLNRIFSIAFLSLGDLVASRCVFILILFFFNCKLFVNIEKKRTFFCWYKSRMTQYSMKMMSFITHLRIFNWELLLFS